MVGLAGRGPGPARTGARYPQPALTRLVRVCVEGGRGDASVEGEVVDGVRNEDGSWDLDGEFIVRTEDGERVRVHGWCRTTVELA